jgi:hypothetical protein
MWCYSKQWWKAGGVKRTMLAEQADQRENLEITLDKDERFVVGDNFTLEVGDKLEREQEVIGDELELDEWDQSPRSAQESANEAARQLFEGEDEEEELVSPEEILSQ